MDRVKILIVEDDVFSANIIKRILTNRGYEITDVVSDSKDVLSSVENIIPDLILMDIVLRGTMDGIELASIIKNKHDIPIIYLTGDASEETIQRAKITEPFGYLIKPISEMTLLTNIELTIFKQNEQIKRNLQILKKVNDELELKVKERTKEITAKNEQLINEIKQREQAEEKLRRSDRLAMIGKMSAVL
ncbi:MAG TPA: response regulator, partial [Ignavibacteria bacterium]|nr:response regulator [Ignavibacteria bacterium]